MNQKRWRTLHILHKKNLSRWSLNSVHLCSKYKSTHIWKKILKLKLHTRPHTLIVVDFNTPFSPMNRSDTQKLIGEIRELECHDSKGLNRHLQNILPKHKRIYHLMAPSVQLTTYTVTKQPSKIKMESLLYLIRSLWLKVRIQQQH